MAIVINEDLLKRFCYHLTERIAVPCPRDSLPQSRNNFPSRLEKFERGESKTREPDQLEMKRAKIQEELGPKTMH